MIVKAVGNGVSAERIAAALDMSVDDIRARLNLLAGLHPQAVELLKDKPIAPGAMAVLKKVSGVRQIEIAELMVSVNNFTSSYAHALFIGTSPDHLLQPAKPKTVKGLSAGEIVRMESEIESLERDFKAAEANHGENMLNLTSLSRYVGSRQETEKNRTLSLRAGPKRAELSREDRSVLLPNVVARQVDVLPPQRG